VEYDPDMTNQSGHEAGVWRSPLPDIEIPNVPLTEFVLRHAARLADKPAVIDGSTDRTMTYGELDHQTRSFAGGLLARGFAKGDVVAVLAPNSHESIVVLLGAAMAGCVTTTINPEYTAREVQHQLEDSKARMVVTVPAKVEAAVTAAAAVGAEVVVIGDDSIDGTVGFDQVLGEPLAAQVPVAGDDVVVLPYSSGTTGSAKGVMLTHRNLVANIAQILPAGIVRDEHEVVDAFLPFFHIYAMQVVVNTALAAGGTVVLLPRFDPVQFLEMHQRYGVTISYLVPPVVLLLANHPMVDGYDLSALRVALSAAAPLAVEQQVRLSERLGVEVTQGYGMTEMSPASHVTVGPDAWPGNGERLKPGSIGVLVPNTEAMVVDPSTGAPVGLDEHGEIWIRGPQVMAGYLNNSEATAATIDEDGWLHTGDLGWVDGDGHFFIADRLKELIKYKGFQVPPAELEGLLLAHPAVADAAVIGRPDDEAGELPIAYVVLADPETSTDEIRDAVNEQIARYKHLAEVIAIDAIPKSASGKILRRQLREP
jgi:acyl-CoA synthetase (AMP-forming)/AMP-acid ligase II